jgi:hypothetical protein
MNTLVIIKEYVDKENNISLSVGKTYKKFSVTKDLFEQTDNYIIKVKNSPLLIPGEYVKIISGEK